MNIDNIYNMDCLEGMKLIPDGSVDAVICDLPYGTTRNAWDSVIPLDKLWEQYRRVIKRNGAIVLFSQQPFTSVLIASNLEMFRYEWIWEKANGTGFLNAKKMPMKAHENILVFYEKLPTYNPQMWKSTSYRRKPSGNEKQCDCYGEYKLDNVYNSDMRYPKDVIKFQQDKEFYNSNVTVQRHPTQKPVDLIAYLIRTYSNPGDTILDNTIGSGTTAVAALREKRHFIGFELNRDYYDIALRRIKAEQSQLSLF